MHYQKLSSSVLLFLLLTISAAVSACTLFTASGPDYVQGGGTLAAKNRDWLPGRQTLKLVTPPQGHRYLGLFTGSKATFNAAGVNDQGLFVAMSTAGSIPKEERRPHGLFRNGENLRGNEYLLRYAGSVLEALAHPEVFQEAVNYLLADKTMAVIVEVFPDGHQVFRLVTDGTLSHTNHYVTATGAEYNRKIGESSRTRYERIQQLLKEAPKPMKLADFISFAGDRHDGKNNSIYRLGLSDKATRTVASFAVYLPSTGSPTVYVRYQPNGAHSRTEKVLGPEVYTF